MDKKEQTETTLDLDQAMQEGMDQFQGELEEAAREETITPQPEQEGPPKDTKSETPAEKPGTQDSAASEAAEAETPTTKETPPQQEQQKQEESAPAKEEQPSLRFKSHEDAENAYKHIQSAKTRAEQEAARLRNQLKEAKTREAAQSKQVEMEKALYDYATDEHEKILEAIEDLDPDDDGYRKKVAQLWSQKDREVERKRRELTTQMESDVAKEVEDDGPAPQREQSTEEPQDQAVIWTEVSNRAREAGVDPDDTMFQMSCRNAPTTYENGEPVPFETQVRWAIDYTKKYHDDMMRRIQDQQKEAANKKSQEFQESNLPMGRTPANKEEPIPDKAPVVTLNDALDSVMEERRL